MSPVERDILALLAREWDLKGPPGIMDVSDIVAALPAAPGDVLAALESLFRSGMTDMNRLKSAAFLTPEGYGSAPGGKDPGPG
jgi:hypothetical protein